MAKITKRTVDALVPRKDRDVLLWDDEIRGFGVRCRPSGVRYYLLKYRTEGGRQRWYTLGKHGDPLTPDTARAMALRERAAVQDGVDPSGRRQNKRQETTISELAARYLTEHVKIHNKPSTADEVERIIEKRIKPKLGGLKISEISRADVKAWHQGMSGMPYEANRALAYCSKMLSLAAGDWELRSDNPCLGIKRFPETARERFFDDEEIRQLGIALQKIEDDGTESAGFVLLVRLLATTGMRLGEVLALRWEHVDLGERAIRLPDAKAGARTVHLGAAAFTILDAIKTRMGYVAHGTDADTPLAASTVGKAWVRLREKAGIPDARLHDWRHTAGTLAALTGANAFVVRDLLGHRTLAMTGRYVERAADMVRATADTMSNRVAAALNAGERKPAEVRDLKNRTA